MNKEINNDLRTATSELLKLVSSSSQEQLNISPFENSWTAAQVAEHLLKSFTLAEVISGPVKETNRDPAEKVNQIKEVLLNFDLKLESPELLQPEIKVYDRTSLLDSLTAAINKITAAADTLDLNETCTAMELPQLGQLTRFEWISFVIYHTQRHTNQIENILNKADQ